MNHRAINLNTQVRVRLSPEGRARVQELYTKEIVHAEVQERSEATKHLREKMMELCTAEWAAFSLWEMMQVFGPMMYIGAVPAFIGNCFVLDVDDSRTVQDYDHDCIVSALDQANTREHLRLVPGPSR